MFYCLLQHIYSFQNYGIIATPPPIPVNVEHAGVYGFVLNIENETMWTGKIPTNYLCGRKHDLMFYPDPVYTSVLTIDWLGSLLVLFFAVCMMLMFTAIWPMLISIDKNILRLNENNKKLHLRTQDMINDLRNDTRSISKTVKTGFDKIFKSNKDKDIELSDQNEKDSQELEEEKESKCFFYFKYIWLFSAAILAVVVTVLVSQVLCCSAGLPNVTKRVFTNKCYMLRYDVEEGNVSSGRKILENGLPIKESSDWSFKLDKDPQPKSMIVSAPCDATFHTTNTNITYRYIPETKKVCMKKKIYVIKGTRLKNTEGKYYDDQTPTDDGKGDKEYSDVQGTYDVEIFNSKILYKADKVPSGGITYKNRDLETDTDFINRLKSSRGVPVLEGKYFYDIWKGGSWCYDDSDWRYWNWWYTTKEIRMKYDVLDVDECTPVVNEDTGLWRIDNSTGKPSKEKVNIQTYVEKSPYDTRPYGWLEWKEDKNDPLNEIIYTTGIKDVMSRSNIVMEEDKNIAFTEMRHRVLNSVHVSLANWEFYPESNKNSIHPLHARPVSPQCKVTFNATVTEDMWEFKNFCKDIILTTVGTNVTKISSLSNSGQCIVPLRFMDNNTLDLVVSNSAIAVTGVDSWRCTNDDEQEGVAHDCNPNGLWSSAKPVYNSDYTKIKNINSDIISPDYSKNTFDRGNGSRASLLDTLKALISSIILIAVFVLISYAIFKLTILIIGCIRKSKKKTEE